MSPSYLVVGAPLVDGLSVDRGAAYVFDAGTLIDPPPTASAGGPYTGQEGQAIQLDGSGSTDPPNAIETLTFAWDLDYDGVTFDSDATGVAPQVVFEDDLPLRTIAVRVTDLANQSSIDLALLEIFNVDPEIAVNQDIVVVDEGDTATNTGTFSDAGQDIVTLSASLGVVTDHGDGTWSWSFTAADGPDDSQTVTITATDDDGGLATVQFDLQIDNAPPALSVDLPSVVLPAGDTATNSGNVGDAGDDEIMLTATLGDIVDNGDGTWSWSYEDLDGTLTQSVTITATDSDGAASEVSFELIAATLIVQQSLVTTNEGEPAANAGQYLLPAGVETVSLTATFGDVVDQGDGTWDWSWLAGDGPDTSGNVEITATYSGGTVAAVSFAVDVGNVPPELAIDNATVVVDEGDTATNTGTFSDAGQDIVTLSASLGVVTDHGDGTWSWSFTAADGPDDSQTVTITATDDDGELATVQFDLQIDNAPPALSVDLPSVVLPAGDTATNSGNVGDAGDDEIMLTATLGDLVDNGDGTWSWSYEDLDGTLTQSVTITATDSDGAASEVSFELIAATLIVQQSLVTTNEGEPAANAGQYLLPAGVETVSLTATFGDVVDQGDGTWDWSWLAGDGPDTSGNVEITATYSGGAVAAVSFAVDVGNVPPELAIDNATVVVDEGDTATNTGTFSDAGQDIVTLSASLGVVTDQGDGTWTWNFLATDVPGNRQTVTITATDDDGAESFVSFELVINNLAPLLTVDVDSVRVARGRLHATPGRFSILAEIR